MFAKSVFSTDDLGAVERNRRLYARAKAPFAYLWDELVGVLLAAWLLSAGLVAAVMCGLAAHRYINGQLTGWGDLKEMAPLALNGFVGLAVVVTAVIGLGLLLKLLRR